MQKFNDFSVLSRVIVIAVFPLITGCQKDAGEKAAAQLADGLRDSAESISKIDPVHLKTLIEDNKDLTKQLFLINFILATSGVGLGVDVGSSNVFFRVRDVAGVISLKAFDNTGSEFLHREYDGTIKDDLPGTYPSADDMLNRLRRLVPHMSASLDASSGDAHNRQVPLKYAVKVIPDYANEAFHNYRQSAQNLPSLGQTEIKINPHISQAGHNDIKIELTPTGKSGSGNWHIVCELVQRSLNDSSESLIAQKEFGTNLDKEDINTMRTFSWTLFVFDSRNAQAASK